MNKNWIHIGKELKFESSITLLIIWAFFLFLSIFIFTFLHECGHGFGAYLDGNHISTGFNRVGDSGKKPKDPDFRSDYLIKGEFNKSGFLGPFINLIGAVLFTVILLYRRKNNEWTLLIGSGALTNSLIRLVPVLIFFIHTASGRMILEDEVEWGLHKVEGIEFPLLYSELKELISLKPSLFIAELGLYFWPVIVFAVCLLCLILSYKKLYKLFDGYHKSLLFRWLFGVMPIIVWPATHIITDKLDNLIRINR